MRFDILKILAALAVTLAAAGCSHKVYNGGQECGTSVKPVNVYTEVRHDTLTMNMFRSEVKDGTLPALDMWTSSSFTDFEGGKVNVTYGHFSARQGRIYTMKRLIRAEGDTLMVLQVRSVTMKQ